MHRSYANRIIIFLIILLLICAAGISKSPAQIPGAQETPGAAGGTAAGGEAEWLRVWGGPEDDHARGVATDSSGNTYVVGWFSGTVDFDPGPYGEGVAAEGDSDAYLSKFDAAGMWQWAKTWGGEGDQTARDVAADGSGNIVVIGSDLRKYKPNGDLSWKREWEGYMENEAVAVDGAGNIYFTGVFGDSIDFDTGSGTTELSPEGMTDAYVCKFNSNGDFQWVRAWGHAYEDFVISDIASDSSGNIYITGAFMVTATGGAVDFNPGEAVEEREASGNYEIFISKFNAAGEFQWVRTWSGEGSADEVDSDMGFGLGLDGSGNVYVAGRFYGTCDFDPGSATVNRTASGRGAFLSEFNSSGAFQWVRTWSGAAAYVVAVKGNGDVFVTGSFSEPADFDPGDETESPRELGHGDVFLSKFSSSGEFRSVRTHCTLGYDIGRRIIINPFGQMIIAGSVGGGEPLTEEGRQPNGWDAFVYVMNDRS